MARAFVQYWKNETWNSGLDDGATLGHTASNGFRKLGVARGDRIFIVTNIGGELYLGGGLTVEQIIDQRQAQKILGNNVWRATDHVIGQGLGIFSKSRRIPVGIARALRFGDDKALVISKGGLVDQQTLRGVRELAPSSAKKLSTLLSKAINRVPGKNPNKAAPGARALRALRNDPQATEGVFDKIFASATKTKRRRWESFLAEAISYVGINYPNHWALSLHRDYLRLNVGMVLCIQFSPWHGATVLLDPKAVPAHREWVRGRLKYSPGCRHTLVAFSDGVESIEGIRRANQLALDVCAGAHGGNGAFRGAHSPAALRYLEAKLGRKLPNPAYATAGRAAADTEAEERAGDRALANQPDLPETEKEALRKYRCGQGLFRERVAALESGCRVTGVQVMPLLRASHIKPWKNSTDSQRLNGNNGLMLAPHIDHLFDQGFISFRNNGDLLVSPRCPAAVLKAWGISPHMNVGIFRSAQRPFLAYHRRKYGFSRGA